jgi:hypothetical protein
MGGESEIPRRVSWTRHRFNYGNSGLGGDGAGSILVALLGNYCGNMKFPDTVDKFFRGSTGIKGNRRGAIHHTQQKCGHAGSSGMENPDPRAGVDRRGAQNNRYILHGPRKATVAERLFPILYENWCVGLHLGPATDNITDGVFFRID